MDKPRVVLCVDDEPEILKSLQRVLRLDGYTILMAPSGEEALQVLSREAVDLVLTDQRMPRMSGSELLNQIRQRYPHIVRMMLSGYSDFGSLVKAVNEGEVYRYFTKPWDNEQLRAVLREAFDRRKRMEAIVGAVQAVVEQMQLSGDLSIEVMEEAERLTLQLSERRGQTLAEEAVCKMLETLFVMLDAQGKERLRMVTGIIANERGVVAITAEVGKGVTLRIELPRVQPPKSGASGGVPGA